MRGFVITLITIVLVTVLLSFSAVLHNNYLSLERALKGPQPLIYGSFVFDSVAYDINEIIGPRIDIYHSNESVGVFISDRIPQQNFSAELSDYEGFLEDEIAEELNIYVDANFSNISSMTINEDYVYTNENNEMLFTASPGTGASAYYVNITVFETRKNLTSFDFNSSGDLNVTIFYSDLNGTVTDSGKVFSDGGNDFKAEYVGGGSLRVEIGNKNGNDGSLFVNAPYVISGVSFFAVLPPINETKRLGYEYDVPMGYSQGKINISRLIGK